jgi:hypothetical protein
MFQTNVVSTNDRAIFYVFGAYNSSELWHEEQLLSNDREMGGYIRAVSGQRLGTHDPAATDTNAKIQELCVLYGPCQDVTSKGQG